ncbi:hypothetical protein FRC17_008807 [Serendipita sp. 399]|nr:hypothetical protein FRC17_008807 [Serendipita sp. 399]
MRAAQRKDVNGRKIGKMYKEFADYWISHANSESLKYVSFEKVDLSKEYWNRVFEPALEVWSHGQTPNPDISEIKFGALLDSLNLEDGWIATGHYARLDRTESPFSDTTHNHENRVRLHRGVDPVKDQSYWLSSVSEAHFRKALFPIGHLTKRDVRRLATEAGLPTASRKESMGICFVGRRRSFSSFLDGYLSPNPGPIITLDGVAIALHQGLWHYTIGQNARISGQPKRMFVAEKRPDRNELVVVDDPRHPAMSRSSILVTNFQWIWREHPPPESFREEGMDVGVKFRSVMQPVPSVLHMRNHSEGEIFFKDKQYGIAAGQIAVAYMDSWCLGGGRIEE